MYFLSVKKKKKKKKKYCLRNFKRNKIQYSIRLTLILCFVCFFKKREKVALTAGMQEQTMVVHYSLLATMVLSCQISHVIMLCMFSIITFSSSLNFNNYCYNYVLWKVSPCSERFIWQFQLMHCNFISKSIKFLFQFYHIESLKLNFTYFLENNYFTD